MTQAWLAYGSGNTLNHHEPTFRGQGAGMVLGELQALLDPFVLVGHCSPPSNSAGVIR
jgi:hypothetical protein